MCSGSHNVYFIISKKRGLYKTYVGYAKNIKKRIEAHNSNKGAKVQEVVIGNCYTKENLKIKN